MHVLALEPGTSFDIGNGTTVSVPSVRNRRVRISITAPSTVGIYRQEIVKTLNEAARRALAPDQSRRE